MIPARRPHLVIHFLWIGLVSGFAGASSNEENFASDIDQAISLAIQARYEEALSIFDRLLIQAPEDTKLLYLSGVTLIHLNRLAVGIVRLEESVGREAPFPQAYVWLAEAYRTENRREDALKVVNLGLKRFPNHLPLLDLERELGP